MSDIDIRDLDKWVKVFGKDGFRKGLDASVTKRFSAAGQMVADEQRRLVPKWRREVLSGIKHVQERQGNVVRVRIGPMVLGPAPKYTATLEGGRAPRRGTFPPYGARSRLMAWVLSHGFPPFMARIIARNIFFRGLPNPRNPRTPNPPPVFVERAWNNKYMAVERELGPINADVVLAMWSELPH